ncbi:ABC transporter ATP-binding protein [Citricoccus sp. SGAir0253]|uniref:ABC transporter ATP-binding protein n=1 Tax=Citricoccus sp. SGAir0253 TaxID=2567881 RepID=UPI0010CD4322|nr:ABC transporter ATP-binding protein [Citricoccus sp. SGAir0253]QCU78108.1 ABC transporter ATP-binding protein [Citricoccus sp. SGAir0253]
MPLPSPQPPREPGRPADVAVAEPVPAPAVPPRPAPAPGPVLVSLRGVHRTVRNRRRGDVHILRGVDFEARAGQVTALLGPNGAGKTTTLTLAQGLDRPDAGTVELLGRDPWRAGSALRSRVGVMLQDGGLPPSATPARLLSHVASLYREPADMPALTARLGIDEFAGRDIRRLSGGQRQRVALAAALAGRPRVVFLDEPSAGLDPVSRQLVFDLVTELKQAGLAVVLTTHLLDDAERLADRIVLLRRGLVERAGTVAELTARTGPAPLSFTVAAPLSPGALGSLPAGLALTAEGVAPETADAPGGCTYRVDGVADPAHWAALGAWWRDAGVMPTDVRLLHRSLEDVFLEVAP